MIGFYAAGAVSGGSGPLPVAPVLVAITPSIFPAVTTSHATAMPATVATGQLLVLLAHVRTSSDATMPAGWTRFIYQVTGAGGGQTFFGYYKITNGTEGGSTVNFETVSSASVAAQVWQFATGSFTGVPTASGLGSTNNTEIPMAVHDSTWLDEDVFWIVGFGSNGGASPLEWSYPDNQTNTATGGGSPCRINSCSTVSDAGVLDPPRMVMNSNTNSAAFTISIRPAP